MRRNLPPPLVVVDSAAQGYRFVWNNRKTCLSIAGLPLLVKIGCLAAALLLGLENNHLRQGLVLLPSYFAEGWMVSLLVRVVAEALAGKQQLKSGNEKNPVLVRLIGAAEKRRINAGMILYVLVQIVYVVLISAMVENLQTQGKAGLLLSGSSPASFLFGMVMIAVLIWAVRLSWLYVPVAMGYSIKHYLRAVQPFVTSFYMIGIALLCSVPVGLALMMFLQLFAALAGAINGGVVFTWLLSPVFQAATQILAAMIGSIAMTFALYPLLSKNQ